MDDNRIQALLDDWFSEAMSKHWFASTPAIDQQLSDRYQSLWQQAQADELKDWQQSASGCLALCIVLDQLPLNMFRGTAKSFSTEQQAVSVAKWAIKQGLDQSIDLPRVSFLYMPLMHSENLADQDLAVACFSQAQLESNVRFAKHHRGIIETFGRFPHRNAILGRDSSPAEEAYLKSD